MRAQGARDGVRATGSERWGRGRLPGRTNRERRKRGIVRQRIAWSWIALCLSALASVASAEQIAHKDLRQDLFTTCISPNGQRWIVGELGRILSTNDNGKTLVRADLDSREAFLSIACSADGSLLVTGQDGLAMRSRDNGATWQELETGTDRTLLSVTYADANVALAVGDFGTIVRTTDGGDTWSKVSLPTEMFLPEDIAEIIEPGDILLYGIDFASPSQGWIAGEFGSIFATTDGGVTWVAQPTGQETTLFDISFVDPQRGWAVGIEEVMLHTEDGGLTWNRQQVPSRPGFVLGLYGVDVAGNIGWAVGDNGLLLRSNDGGRSWERVDLPIEFAANWLRDIDLNQNGEGLIVGGSGILISTQGAQYTKLGQ